MIFKPDTNTQKFREGTVKIGSKFKQSSASEESVNAFKLLDAEDIDWDGYKFDYSKHDNASHLFNNTYDVMKYIYKTKVKTDALERVVQVKSDPSEIIHLSYISETISGTLSYSSSKITYNKTATGTINVYKLCVQNPSNDEIDFFNYDYKKILSFMCDTTGPVLFSSSKNLEDAFIFAEGETSSSTTNDTYFRGVKNVIIENICTFDNINDLDNHLYIFCGKTLFRTSPSLTLKLYEYDLPIPEVPDAIKQISTSQAQNGLNLVCTNTDDTTSTVLLNNASNTENGVMSANDYSTLHKNTTLITDLNNALLSGAILEEMKVNLPSLNTGKHTSNKSNVKFITIKLDTPTTISKISICSGGVSGDNPPTGSYILQLSELKQPISSFITPANVLILKKSSSPEYAVNMRNYSLGQEMTWYFSEPVTLSGEIALSVAPANGEYQNKLPDAWQSMRLCCDVVSAGTSTTRCCASNGFSIVDNQQFAVKVYSPQTLQKTLEQIIENLSNVPTNSLAFTSLNGSNTLQFNLQPQTLSMSKDMLFGADDNAISPKIQYSFNKVIWNEYTNESLKINQNETLFVRGDNYTFNSQTKQYGFSITPDIQNAKIKVDGNISSLLNKDATPNDYIFSRLFENVNNMQSAPTLDIKAANETTYKDIFGNCKDISHLELIVNSNPSKILKSLNLPDLSKNKGSLRVVCKDNIEDDTVFKKFNGWEYAYNDGKSDTDVITEIIITEEDYYVYDTFDDPLFGFAYNDNYYDEYIKDLLRRYYAED